MKIGNVRLIRPFFSKTTVQRAGEVTSYSLVARNFLQIVRSELGIYQVEFAILGFGFYYYNLKKRGL